MGLQIAGREADHARARFANGELHVSVPKIAERRGRAVEIAIEETPEGHTEAKASLVVGGDRRFGGWFF